MPLSLQGSAWPVDVLGTSTTFSGDSSYFWLLTPGPRSLGLVPTLTISYLATGMLISETAAESLARVRVVRVALP